MPDTSPEPYDLKLPRLSGVPGTLPPNGLPCLDPSCDDEPRGNYDLCPPHQRFENHYREWLRWGFDRERERLTLRR